MQRELLKSLVDWKDKPNRKPLILNGVRQCGKTYLLKEFGRQYFDDVAYFNFEDSEALKAVFASDFDVNRILFELSLMFGKTIEPSKTLVIFDEIQECGRALTSLKYFDENSSEYHIVCAGSLLGIALHGNLSFPVGKVDFLTLYPMSFFEFLMATESEMLVEYVGDLGKGDELTISIADRLENKLREYYLVGGMPAAVKTWVESRDITKVEEIQQNIINSYELDFAKHAPVKEFPKLVAVWKSIPEQLAKENAKFIFGQVKSSYRAKDLEDALQWLISAGLVQKVCRVSKPYMPLSSYSEETAFKLYLTDVGLLRKLAKLPAEALLDGPSYYREFKGAMTENYVLGELIKRVDDSAYYWTSGNVAEVDFIIQCGKYILPIEVKSERHVTSRSLAEYIKKYQPERSVKTSMNADDMGGETVVKVPLYLIGNLKRML